MTTPGLHPVSGNGVLSRHGSLIVLCSADEADESTVEAVLAAHEEVAHAKGDAMELADRIAGVVAGSAGMSVVAFGPSGGSVLVTVFGHAWVDATTEHAQQRLAPKNATNGVRSLLPGSLVDIRAGLGDADTNATPQRWGNLEHGSVQAGGLVLVAEAASTGEAAGGADSDRGAHAAPDTVQVPVGLSKPVAQPTVPAAVPAQPEPPAEPEPPAQAEAPPAPEPSPAPEPTAPEAPAPTPEPPAPEPPAPAPEPPAPEPPLPPAPEPPPAPAPPAAPPQPLPPQPELVLPPPVPIPAVAPVTAEVDRSKPFESISLLPQANTAPQVEQRAPLPVAEPPAEPVSPEVAAPAHPIEDHGVQVLGVYCKNGHFDDPAARYCAVCGISMAQLTLVPRPGPRPPLGVLVLDDGSVFSLEKDYIIGRDPSRDERVIDGSARPLRLEDPKGLISRAHVHVRLDGWQVQVVDLGSANGTGLFGPGDAAWQPAPRLTPVPIRPGTQVGLGQRQLRFESHTNT